MRKILFLDIDGVLNSRQSTYYYYRTVPEEEQVFALCPICVSNLNLLMEKAEGTDIVVHSTWGRRFGVEELRERLCRYGFRFPERVKEITPKKMSSSKREEISFWLNDNNDTKFVILDDRDMGRPLSQVTTDSSVGLTWYNVISALELLGYDLEKVQMPITLF